MGQILHGSVRTTAGSASSDTTESGEPEYAGAALRHQSQDGGRVAEWKKRNFTHDARMGAKGLRSIVLTWGEEAACVAFRKHTPLLLDDRL